MLPGVHAAKKKNSQIYYRSGIHYRGKHISLGSFEQETAAHEAYLEAGRLLSDAAISMDNVSSFVCRLSFSKCVTLLNFRDNHIYIKTPIYLQKGFFVYYLSPEELLKFDNDDLFYYSSHTIQRRKGHLFVSDYGMQYNILSRYGIKNFAVAGRDYQFANGDPYDFRYSNIIVINKYHGVQKISQAGRDVYLAKIHLNGDYLLGRYSTEAAAAVAYNKAVDFARDHGYQKNFIENYVLEYTPKEYADIYTAIRLSPKYLSYIRSLAPGSQSAPWDDN